jgi:hypothetical protein
MQRVMTWDSQDELAQQPNQEREAEKMHDELDVHDTGKSVRASMVSFFGYTQR